MATQLTLEKLRDAVAGRAAAFRTRVALQPAGGEGTKVFPPTYSGAVYATEKRRLPGHDRRAELECPPYVGPFLEACIGPISCRAQGVSERYD